METNYRRSFSFCFCVCVYAHAHGHMCMCICVCDNFKWNHNITSETRPQINTFWIQKSLSHCKWELLSYSAFSVPCQPNDRLSTKVCRKSLSGINPVTVMVPPDLCLSSACGNKTLWFKLKRLMGRKRHSNTHLHSFFVLICLYNGIF